MTYQNAQSAPVWNDLSRSYLAGFNLSNGKGSERAYRAASADIDAYADAYAARYHGDADEWLAGWIDAASDYPMGTSQRESAEWSRWPNRRGDTNREIDAAHDEALAYEVAQAALAYGAALTNDTTWLAATAGTATYLGAVVPARYNASADALWLYRPVYDTGIVGWARVFVGAQTFVATTWVTDVDMAHAEALTADAAHNAAADAAWATRQAERAAERRNADIDPIDGFDYSPTDWRTCDHVFGTDGLCHRCSDATEPDLTGWQSDEFVSGTVKAFPLESEQRYPARLYSDGRLTVAIGWRTYGTDEPRYESLAATTLPVRIAILASWVEETDPASTDWSTVLTDDTDATDDTDDGGYYNEFGDWVDENGDEWQYGRNIDEWRHGYTFTGQTTDDSSMTGPSVDWSTVYRITDPDLAHWLAEMENVERAHAEALAENAQRDAAYWALPHNRRLVNVAHHWALAENAQH